MPPEDLRAGVRGSGVRGVSVVGGQTARWTARGFHGGRRGQRWITGGGVDTMGLPAPLSNAFSTESRDPSVSERLARAPARRGPLHLALSRCCSYLGLSTFPQGLLLLLMFYIGGVEVLLLWTRSPADSPPGSVSCHLSVMTKKERFSLAHRSVADAIGERSRDAFRARPFALQDTDRDHIMTA